MNPHRIPLAFATVLSTSFAPLASAADVASGDQAPQSAPATQPQFCKGLDPRVSENSGPQTIRNWVLRLWPELSQDAQQKISFEIIANSNPNLFSAPPALSPEGDLSFTPKETTGEADITLVAHLGGSTSEAQSFTIRVQETPPSATPKWWHQKFAIASATAFERGDPVEAIIDSFHSAGFNTLTAGQPRDEMPKPDRDSTREEYLRALERAATHGIKLFLVDQTRLTQVKSPEVTALQTLIDEYRSHAALGGYFVWDRPSGLPPFDPSEVFVAETISSYLREHDPERARLCPLAVPPMQGGHYHWPDPTRPISYPSYPEFLVDSINKIQPEILTFVLRAIRKSDDPNLAAVVSDEFFPALALWSDLSRQSGAPLWCCIQASGGSDLAPETEATLRFQTNAALAYGTSGFQYLAIGTIVQPDGTPAPSHATIAQINSEIAPLAILIPQLTRTGVVHTGRVPPLEHAFKPNFLGKISEASEDLVLSSFRDPRGDEYLFILSKNLATATVAQLVFPPDARLYELPEGTELALPDGRLALSLTPGGGRLLRFTPPPPDLLTASQQAGAPAPPPAPPAPPTPEEIRIARMEQAFQAACNREGGEQCIAQIATLNRDYIAELDRTRIISLRSRQQKAADAIAQEMELVRSGKSPSPTAEPDAPVALTNLRRIYLETAAHYTRNRDRLHVPLYDRYLAAMDAFQAELTKAGATLEAIKKVQAVRQSVGTRAAALRAALEPMSASPSSTHPGDTSSWRRVAHCVLSNGGTLGFRQKTNRAALADGVASTPKELPSRRFEVTSVSIPNAANLSPDDLALLGSARSLVTVMLANLLKVNSLRPLRDMEQLGTLSIDTAPLLSDADFAILESFPNLTALSLFRTPLTDASIATIAKCRKLATLAIGGTGMTLTPDGIRQITAIQTLHSVTLYQLENLTDPCVETIAELPDLAELFIEECPAFKGESCWNAFANSTTLKSARVRTCSCKAAGIAELASIPSLERLAVGSVPDLDDSNLAQLASAQHLTALAFDACPFTGTGFSAFQSTRLLELVLANDMTTSGEALTPIATAFPNLFLLELGPGEISSTDLTALASLRQLRVLSLSGPKIGDEHIAQLVTFPALEALTLNGSTVTGRGLTALKALKSLHSLSLLNSPSIDDSAIPALKDLNALTSLVITATRVTEAGAEWIRKTLRACTLTYTK